MERFEYTHVVYRVPRREVPLEPHHVTITPQLVKEFRATNSRVTDSLMGQISEFLCESEDNPAFIERVFDGLSETIAKCSFARVQSTSVDVILIRHNLLLENGLTFLVNCTPGWQRPIVIPEEPEVPRVFDPSHLEHLGYRRMIEAADALEVYFIPSITLTFNISFFDPRS